MGLLDWLMFWKKDEDSETTGYQVEGCFTLPSEVDPDTDPGPIEVNEDCVPDLALSDRDPVAEA